MTDRITLRGMHFFAHVGCSAEERRVGTHVEVDIDMLVDLRDAGATDDIQKSIDYAKVHRAAREAIEAREFHLLEAIAHDVAMAAKRFGAERVVVRVRKERPPIEGHFDHAEVEIER